MFENCSKLTSLDLLGWDIFSVENMNYMFKGCSKLRTIDVSSFNTLMTPFLMGMFQDCSSLTKLDLSNWDTRNATHMSNMFNGCSKLRTIYVGGGWTVQWVGSSDGMFYDCTSLVGGMGTTYNASHTDKAYAHIDGGPNNPGYFTDPNTVVVLFGDVTGDDVVDIDDVNAVINIILKVKDEDDFPGNADLNNDGTVDVDDMNIVINIILTH